MVTKEGVWLFFGVSVISALVLGATIGPMGIPMISVNKTEEALNSK